MELASPESETGQRESPIYEESAFFQALAGGEDSWPQRDAERPDSRRF